MPLIPVNYIKCDRNIEEVEFFDFIHLSHKNAMVIPFKIDYAKQP